MMQTRRHPRTLNEAFGPYTSHDIYEPPESFPWTWWTCIAAMALVALAVLVATA